MPGLFTLLLVAVVVVLLLVFISGFLRYIPNSRVGIVEKGNGINHTAAHRSVRALQCSITIHDRKITYRSAEESAGI